MRFLDPLRAETHALLRIVAGLMFLWHGTQKLFGFPGEPMEIPAHIQYVAGPIELVGGGLVMIGLFARPAAFLCSGLMAFAYFIAHAPRITQGFDFLFPSINQGELAALYCFVFLFLAANGPGKWSVDRVRAFGA